MTTSLTRNEKLLAIGLVLEVTLVAFEVTAVITALPSITDELGGDSLYGVALASYTLANLVSLVVTAEMADRYGPTMPYLLSITMFVAGLAVAATAPSMVVVVIGRTMQGAGTGGLAPIAYLLVRRAFPADRQAIMYAFLSAGWVLPSLIAPAISGVITDRFGWRWVFAGIIPLAIAVAAFASVPMRAYPPEPDAWVGRRTRVPAALLAAAGVGLLVTGLQFANPVAAVAAVIVGGGLAVPALRTLLPPGVGRAAAGLPAVLAVRILATATFLGVDSFIPLAADRIHGASPTVQGFTIVGAAVTWTGGQWLVAKRQHVVPSRFVRLGFACLVIGILSVLPVLWEGWPLWATFITWAIGGFGMGLLFNPTSVSAMSYAVEGVEGRVSSQVNLADSLGFSLMGGIGGGLVALADRTDLTLQAALGTSFGLALTLALLGLIASRGVRPAPSV